MLKTGIRWAAFIALILTCVWVYTDAKLESWIAAASALVVLLGTFLPVGSASPNQRQAVSEGATGIQAGGDVIVGGSVKSRNSDV